MEIKIKVEDASTVAAALLAVLNAQTRGMTEKDRDDVRRILREIAEQAQRITQ